MASPGEKRSWKEKKRCHARYFIFFRCLKRSFCTCVCCCFALRKQTQRTCCEDSMIVHDIPDIVEKTSMFLCLSLPFLFCLFLLSFWMFFPFVSRLRLTSALFCVLRSVSFASSSSLYLSHVSLVLVICVEIFSSMAQAAKKAVPVQVYNDCFVCVRFFVFVEKCPTLTLFRWAW